MTEDAHEPAKADAEPVADDSAEPPTATLRELAIKYGLETEVDAIDRRLAEARQSDPTIVVVGELNRGKSSLVNALLGRGSLAPVGSGETTALPINFVPERRGQPGEAWIEFALPAAGSSGAGADVQPISIDDLAAWVTIDGVKLAEEIERMPTQAFVVADAGLPSGATIVDTPGAGGLVEAHALRAIARSESASLLVVVTDASGRLTTSAVDFMKRCVQFVESVIVVVNKTDTSRSWSSIAEENREVLAGSFPRLANAPIVGVSALRAVQALDDPDDRRRQKLIDLSRLGDLRDALAGELEDVARLTEANAVRHLISVVSPVLESRQTERDLVAGDTKAQEDLQRRQRQLQRLESLADDWTYDWAARIGRYKSEVHVEIETSVTALVNSWRGELAQRAIGFKPAEAVELHARLLADIEMLYAETAARVTEQALDALNDLFATAGWKPPDRLVSAVADAPKSHWRDLVKASDAGADPRKEINLMIGLVRPAFYLTGMGGGAAVAATALWPLLVAVPLVPAAVAGGVFIAKRKAEKDKLAAAITSAEKALKQDLDLMVTTALTTIQSLGKRDFSGTLKRAHKETKRLGTAADQARRQSDEQRRARLVTLDREISELSTALAAAHEQLGG